MERTFLDTNILLYAEDADAGEKREMARTRISTAVSSATAVLSTQVLQEFFVRATQKLGLSAEAARARIDTYSRLDIVLLDPELILAAIDLQRLRRLSFWDSLILKAAIVSGCSTLLTEDLQHGQVFDGVRIENPFAGRE